MIDDKEHHPTSFQHLRPAGEKGELPASQRKPLDPPNQEDTLDDLDNSFLEDDEGPVITRLADDWQGGFDSLFYPRSKRPARSFAANHVTANEEFDLNIDITADFPTTSNPFDKRQDTALIHVAKSESTALATLRWLAQNVDAEIRKAVAENPKADAQILRKLCKDWDGTVRLAVLDNPNVPMDVVAELAADINPLVSLRACYALDEHRRKTST